MRKYSTVGQEFNMCFFYKKTISPICYKRIEFPVHWNLWCGDMSTTFVKCIWKWEFKWTEYFYSVFCENKMPQLHRHVYIHIKDLNDLVSVWWMYMFSKLKYNFWNRSFTIPHNLQFSQTNNISSYIESEFFSTLYVVFNCKLFIFHWICWIRALFDQKFVELCKAIECWMLSK